MIRVLFTAGLSPFSGERHRENRIMDISDNIKDIIRDIFRDILDIIRDISVDKCPQSW